MVYVLDGLLTQNPPVAPNKMCWYADVYFIHFNSQCNANYTYLVSHVCVNMRRIFTFD